MKVKSKENRNDEEENLKFRITPCFLDKKKSRQFKTIHCCLHPRLSSSSSANSEKWNSNYYTFNFNLYTSSKIPGKQKLQCKVMGNATLW